MDVSLTAAQGLPYNPGEYEFESGQMVINRARTWDALLVAAEINKRYASYYRFMSVALCSICCQSFITPASRVPGTATKTRFVSLSK
jgi:hypothetical protein